jgi:hypothetical protein
MDLAILQTKDITTQKGVGKENNWEAVSYLAANKKDCVSVLLST